MRLFVAICVEEPMRSALIGLQSELKKQGMRGSYIKSQNLHLTLAFIGECDDSDGILKTMEAVHFEPFFLRLKGISHFGKIYWAGVEENESLNDAAQQVRSALIDGGIRFDSKPFVPHITVLKKAEQIMSELPAPVQCEMKVSKISLMLSTFGEDGVIYTEIGTVSARSS